MVRSRFDAPEISRERTIQSSAMDITMAANHAFGATALRDWPEHGLDVSALKAGGWMPVPLNQFILKIHSRCNLACDYCYMYELADQSWRGRPFVMSRDTIRAAASRIAEYARRHQLSAVRISLHGGEPLLAGPELIDFLASEMSSAISPQTDLRLGIQTNAAKLSARILDVLAFHGIRGGVSLDGDKAAHHLHPRYRTGRSSYDRVVRGLDALTADRYRHLFSGFLAVIDLDNDPVTTYESLARFDAPGIDFLLPHGTWASMPPGKSEGITSTRYAEWLIEA